MYQQEREQQMTIIMTVPLFTLLGYYWLVSHSIRPSRDCPWVGVNLRLCLRQRHVPALLVHSSQFERLFSTAFATGRCATLRLRLGGALHPWKHLPNRYLTF